MVFCIFTHHYESNTVQTCILMTMHITVFGANGKVRSKVVLELLSHNHTVVAAIHNGSNLPDHKLLTKIPCDIHKKSEVITALDGSDAVISCLGSWGTRSKDIQVQAMQHIIPTMKENGIKRIISLTGAGVKTRGDKPDVLNDMGILGLKIFAGKVYKDGQEHLDMLALSDLDWTVLRSPIMQEVPSKGYLLGMQRPQLWETISRNDVSRAILKILESNSYVKQSPFIRTV